MIVISRGLVAFTTLFLIASCFANTADAAGKKETTQDRKDWCADLNNVCIFPGCNSELDTSDNQGAYGPDAFNKCTERCDSDFKRCMAKASRKQKGSEAISPDGGGGVLIDP